MKMNNTALLNLASVAALALAPAALHAAEDGSIRAQVSGMRSDDGKLACLLFDDKAGWPGKVEAAVAESRVQVSDGQGECVFPAVESDRYAVAVMHDENDDGKMKQNLIGIPREGYGASNDAANGFMSGPKYEAAVFEHDGAGTRLSIEMRY
ncbi:MAG: DUF2141 domain-containing protein [Myxococcota bacterium]